MHGYTSQNQSNDQSHVGDTAYAQSSVGSYDNVKVAAQIEPQHNDIEQAIKAANSPTTDAAGHSPFTANDSDLIEDEWVEAAKKIIESNASDPFQQSKAMIALKADYMKKRYNKDIKTSGT